MTTLNPAEIDTIYVYPEDRFIVSLIVGYSEEDLSDGAESEAESTPQEAARWALDLTKDEGARGTHWFVFDRKTGRMHLFEQSDFDPEMTSVDDGQTLIAGQLYDNETLEEVR